MANLRHYYKPEVKPDHRNHPINFTKVSVFVPPCMYKALKQTSKERHMPVSRLILYAIDNEYEAPTPFRYGLDLPAEYEEYKYADAAGKLTDFLLKYPDGVAPEFVLLQRRSFGIEDRHEVLGGLQELFEKGMAEWVKPHKTKFKKFKPDYMHIKLIADGAKFYKRRHEVE